MNQTTPQTHLGIAEQGKVHALKKEFEMALLHYREAMKQAVAAQAPEVFFRYYLQCSLEVLEHMESYDDVLAYCDKALRHYETNPPPNEIAHKDRIEIYQRQGVNLLKQGHRQAAQDAFNTAMVQAKALGMRVPLSEKLAQWLSRNWHIDRQRLQQEQERHRYFTVRPDTVDPNIAIPLPSHIDSLPNKEGL